MNLYLYPWHDSEGNNKIGSITAKSFPDCKDKLIQHLINEYEDLNDTLEYDELLNQLEEEYGVCIGELYDITEF